MQKHYQKAGNWHTIVEAAGADVPKVGKVLAILFSPNIGHSDQWMRQTKVTNKSGSVVKTRIQNCFGKLKD